MEQIINIKPNKAQIPFLKYPYCFFPATRFTTPHLIATPSLDLTPLNAWPVASGVKVTSSVWLSPVMNPPTWTTPLQRRPIGYLETLHSTTVQMVTAWQTIPSCSAMPRASGFPQKVRPCPGV